MKITLPDLGEGFSVKAINDNNTFTTKVEGKAFSIAPGTYLLVRSGITATVSPGTKLKNIVLKEFFAPPSDLNASRVLHSPRVEINAGTAYTVDATIATLEEPESVELSILAGFRPKVYTMKRVSGYQYRVTLPEDEIREGFLRYFISVGENGKTTTFPGGKEGRPTDWDFRANKSFEVRVVAPRSAVFIFNALSDNNELTRLWSRESSFTPTSDPGKAEVRINVEKLFVVDPENPAAERILDYSMRYFFKRKIDGRMGDLRDKKKLIFRGRSLTNEPSWVQLALVTKNGDAYGGVIKVDPESKDYSLPLPDLHNVKLVTLPRPYPTFLPYFFEGIEPRKFDINEIESLQISIGPGIPESELGNSHTLAIESVRLE